jgi:predicted acyl esterase
MKKQPILSQIFNRILGFVFVTAGWLLCGLQPAFADTSGMVYEHNVPITMRDGTVLVANVFRPDGPGPYPVIMLSGIYDKDAPWTTHADSGVYDTQGDDTYLNFEAPNPGFWIPQGYAIVHVAARGYGGSEGYASYLSEQEAEDYYDSIEWAGSQSWSNGNVGILGISYYTSNQYRVATLKPPHLKAIIPWEGGSDAYRDLSYQGGMFCTFDVWWYYFSVAPNRTDWKYSQRAWIAALHPFYDDYWQAQVPDLSLLDVPMLAVGQWSDQELHLRGTINAYLASQSPYKKLLLFAGTHWTQFYNSFGTGEQKRFFDYWLKGIDNGLYNEPPIKMQVRTGTTAEDYTLRYESEWPLARTQWTQMYLDASPNNNSSSSLASNRGGLSRKAPTAAGQLTIQTVARGPNAPARPDGVWFTTPPLTHDTEITGPMMAQLWVSSDSSDLPVFVQIQDIDENGNEVQFPFIVPGSADEPVAKGWLLASERKLDPEKSTFYTPYHTHDAKQRLKSGEVVSIQVEIWPTSLVFKKRHQIRVQIRLNDYFHDPIPGTPDVPAGLVPKIGTTFPFIDLSYHLAPPVGRGTIYTGADHASYVLLPVIDSN